VIAWNKAPDTGGTQGVTGHKSAAGEQMTMDSPDWLDSFVNDLARDGKRNPNAGMRIRVR
jgi:hypothetical protein